MKVLIVEDDPVASLVLSRILMDRGYEITACTSAIDAMKVLKEAFYPLIFLDLLLPGGLDGFSLCRWIRDQPDGDRHLILIGTGSDRSDDLQRILEAGADDYIIKPYQVGVLEVRLAIAQKRVKNIETRKTLEANLREERERLRYLATHDPLTKLANRAVFMESLKSAVQGAREGSCSTLLYLDLDNFKVINDSLGHAAGDKILTKIATVLKTSVRSQDLPFRLGGDEFAILLRGLKLPEAKAIAERIRSRIEAFVYSDSGRIFTVGTSIGIAAIEGTVSEKDIMAFADSACYSAKAHGRTASRSTTPTTH
jgi:diguanylate cyclase (GGDEF)-like protein